MTDIIKNYMISEKNYADDMQNIVVPYITARENEGYFKGYDGRDIHYLTYRADNERAAIVISHGYTESCRKYGEMAYYFLLSGYSVYIPDHRGHGQSYRKVRDMTLTHIDKFEEYIDDLEVFVDKVVKPTTASPLYLFAHSMGGAVGALYLERHPAAFDKAILSSPMIAPDNGNIPVWIGKLITIGFKMIGKGETRAFISDEYPGEERFEDGYCTSPARFSYYEQKRRSTDYLQNYSPSYSWVCESMGVTRKILRKGMPESIRTRVKIFSAENENIVKVEPQKKLAARLSGNDFTVIHGAKHEIFLSTDDVLAEYLEAVLEFYDSPAR